MLRAQVGDRDALIVLHERYNAKLLYYVRRLLGAGDAEDALQEVWMTVVKKIGALEEPRALKTWLYRIARNRAISVLRRRRNDVSLADLDEEPESSGDGREEDELSLAGFDAAALHAGLERLSPRHREVLTLRFLEDLSYEEIADVVGCGLGTVRSRIHYAKKSLHGVLTAPFGDN